MILIIDNGSQYTHLIKRNCRDLGFANETINAREEKGRLNELLESGVKKIILSGGPGSVFSDPPNLSGHICNEIKTGKLTVPLLGICYGHQMICHTFGAKVAKGKTAEYGLSEIIVDEEDLLFKGVNKKFRAWASHFDEAKEIPSGFRKLAHSQICEIESMKHEVLPIFGVQFHPEVWHTENGETILKNFLD